MHALHYPGAPRTLGVVHRAPTKRATGREQGKGARGGRGARAPASVCPMFDHTGEWTGAKTLEALWAIRDSTLTTQQKVVLYTLTLRAKPTPDGMTCFPSLATIAKDTGLSRRCVVDVVGELLSIDVTAELRSAAERAAGRKLDVYRPDTGHGWHLLTRESGGPEQSNTYTVDLDAITALPRHTPPKRPRA